MESKTRNLIIGYDNCKNDVPTLVVCERKSDSRMAILNSIHGYKANEIYRILIGADNQI